MNEKTEIEAGQVYIEDCGPGRLPNRIHVCLVEGYYVRYTKSQPVEYKMSRIRFEGLVKSGVFVLAPDKVYIEDKSSIGLERKIQSLLAEGKECRQACLRERAARVTAENELRLVKNKLHLAENELRAGRIRDKQPRWDDFQPDDVWVSPVYYGGREARVIEDCSVPGKVGYKHRTCSGDVQNNVFPVQEFARLAGSTSKLLRGRLTDYHCRCGKTCRGNDIQHWCVNPHCEHVGQINLSNTGKTVL